MQYNSVMKEIIDSRKPIIDPRSSKALLWHVPGSMNGKVGQWELAINPTTNEIYHYNFTSRLK